MRARPVAAIRICSRPASAAVSGSSARAARASRPSTPISPVRKLAWISAIVVEVLFGTNDEVRAIAPTTPPATAHRMPAAAPVPA